MLQKTHIISHRGVCRDSQNSPRVGENTIEAFDAGVKALEALGFVKAIEFDVRLSKDGIPVVIHDELIDRTTNGKGLVRKYTALELQQFDAGFGRKIPLLSEALSHFNNRGVWLHIELKETNLSPHIQLLVSEYGLQNKVIISAFDHDDAHGLDRQSGFCPSWEDLLKIKNHVPIALLATKSKIEKYGLKNYIEAAANANAKAINPDYTAVNQEMVILAHDAGLKVNSWTVNEIEVFKKFNDWGVDNVFCDNPKFLS